VVELGAGLYSNSQPVKSNQCLWVTMCPNSPFNIIYIIRILDKLSGEVDMLDFRRFKRFSGLAGLLD
jgi:hypothetical protein